MSITTHCMILNLHLGIWTGQKLDKEATMALTRGAGADNDAARVNKHLVSKESMKLVTAAANAIRTHFYNRTLPWKDNGDRVIKRDGFTKFIEEHEDLVAKFHAEVRAFASETYASELDRASFRMGDLFKPEDYPTPGEVQRRFHVKLSIDPVTTFEDFRVDLDDANEAKVRANMEAAVHDRVGKAMSAVWERMLTVVGNYIERTKAGTGIRIELVNNLREIVDLLPELNIIDDPRVTEIRALIDAKLTQHEAVDLRTDPDTRAKAAADAEDIMERMRGFMSAMSQE